MGSGFARGSEYGRPVEGCKGQEIFLGILEQNGRVVGVDSADFEKRVAFAEEILAVQIVPTDHKIDGFLTTFAQLLRRHCQQTGGAAILSEGNSIFQILFTFIVPFFHSIFASNNFAISTLLWPFYGMPLIGHK